MGFFSKKVFYLPFPITIFTIYLLLYITLVLFLFKMFLISIFDLPFWVIELIIFASILGSAANIPIFSIIQREPILRGYIVSFWGIPIVVPSFEFEERKTIVAVNVGGCVIPTALSLYLIYKLIQFAGSQIFLNLILAIGFNSILINSVSKPVRGVGIATPAFLPPIFTALTTIIFLPTHNLYWIRFAFAYPVGTLGALIGADLMNLRKIPELGAPIASIGGAGTFDGIFLTGLLSIIFLI